jgi:lysophospholipid acyltransferase (LPLAT)-like uncharacterized protein
VPAGVPQRHSTTVVRRRKPLENAAHCIYVQAVSSARAWLRRGRFWALEHIALPLVMPVFRVLAWTWRVRGPQATAFREMMALPRVMLATFHGMMLQLLRFAPLPAAYDRQVVVMLSPSLDGKLLAAALEHLGIGYVYGTSGDRSVAGAREFIRRVKAGDIGVIAVDGPLGPCCVAKKGFLQIAAAADAHVTLAATSAGPGVRFGSWDRAHLPLPFSWVELWLQVLPAPAEGSEQQMLSAVQQALVAAERALRSPVLPPAWGRRSDS